MDFSLILFLLLVGTGLIWGMDRLLFAQRRGAGRKEPLPVEYARAFFPVILIVFLLRSFLVEPFRIPSGSMMPNLFNGDFILVNKYAYGVRLPVINIKAIGLDDPKRGDVVVFRYPGDTRVNYIKRIIGVSGDRVAYRGKRITVNDVPFEYGNARPYLAGPVGELGSEVAKLSERVNGVEHDILVTDRPEIGAGEFTVPAGHYFVMGDNRDHSNDSRFWGFVPDRNLVGRAFFIWFSLDWSAPEGWLWERIVWNRIGERIN